MTARRIRAPRAYLCFDDMRKAIVNVDAVAQMRLALARQCETVPGYARP